MSLPGIDEQMRLSSVIDAEFKFDLIDYLARWPDAPVHSLGEILDRGDYSAALEHDLQAPQRADLARHAGRRRRRGRSATTCSTLRERR